MPLANRTIRTRQAEIAVRESAGSGLPVLLIHGNSSAKEVFHRQLEGPLADQYHFIAMDLPGHGASSDAFEPLATYSMPGYAEVAVEVLAAMGVDRAAVFGWSLGGHVAMEMIPRYAGLVGLMISAAPPVSPTVESIQAGHRANPLMGLLGKETLSIEEMAMYADAVYGDAVDDQLLQALRRTDGRARRLLFETLFDGRTADQRSLVINAPMPVAIVNGAEDPIVNTDYIGGLDYKNLWDKHCYTLRGVGHAAFLTNPDSFNPIFERFLKDMAQRAASKPGSASSEVAAA